jgi:MazG family protein
MTESSSFDKLCEIVAKLRAPGGCPWDREQTHESLLPATIEEAYEVAEAARTRNDTHFREELGDLLLLVVMHAEIAREASQFNIDNVIAEITEKLIRRHPHVFGESDVRDAGAVLKQWEAIKREERKRDQHYLASLPSALPALMRAQKAQAKAARVNFDWAELRDVLSKIEEELAELEDAIESEDRQRSRREPSDVDGKPKGSTSWKRVDQSIEDELGDLLFAVVNLSRKCRVDAETALQAATDKFVRRFNLLEDELRNRGKKLGNVDLTEMDEIWNQIKKTPNAQRRTRNI